MSKYDGKKTLNDFDKEYLFKSETEKFSFKFYPELFLFSCFNIGNMLKTINYISKRGIDPDWKSLDLKKFQFLGRINPKWDHRDWMDALSRVVKDSDCASTRTKKTLLENNINKVTGKVISYNYITATMGRLNREVKQGKRTKQDLCDFFNMFNVEDEEDRKKRGADIIIPSTKSREVILKEGKRALYSLYRKGMLIRQTKEEILEKMEKYKRD